MYAPLQPPPELVDAIPPTNKLNLSANARSSSRADFMHETYASGFTGACLQYDVDEQGHRTQRRGWDGDLASFGALNWDRDDSIPAKRFSEIVNTLKRRSSDGAPLITTQPAFDAWARDGTGNEGPFQIYQDYGDCVDASAIELACWVLGWRAMQPEYREVFKWLAAFFWYALRGYCSDGWWGKALAQFAIRYGWCPWKLIDVEGHQLDFRDEDTHERWAAREVCRRGPPQWLLDWVSANFKPQDGAITEFDGGLDELWLCSENGIALHHGSNYTAARGDDPGSLTRIGGHQQTMYFGDRRDSIIKFFYDQGVKVFSLENWPCANGQTWGPGWRGETPDRLHPFGADDQGIMRSWEYVKTKLAEIISTSKAQKYALAAGATAGQVLRAAKNHKQASDFLSQFSGGWGPKPEGEWLVPAEKQLKFFGEAMAWHAEKFVGIPGDVPPPPPPPPGEESYFIDGSFWICRKNADGTTEKLQKSHIVPYPGV